jgi:hypothetical protein
MRNGVESQVFPRDKSRLLESFVMMGRKPVQVQEDDED